MSNSYYEESVKIYNEKKELEQEFDQEIDSNKTFYIEEIIRAHSSGDEQSRKKSFNNFNEMFDYLKGYFPIVTVEEWNQNDDFFIDETMKIEAPKPNDDFLSIILNPKRLYDFMTSSSGGKIYGPYSKFCYLVPYEIHVYSEINDS
jgi:hypothetical protein